MRKILAIIIALTTFVSTVHINSYASGDTDAQQMEERRVISGVIPQDDRPDSRQPNLGNPTSSQAHRDADPQQMEDENPCSNISDVFSDKAVGYVFGDDRETVDILQSSFDDRVESEKSKADRNVYDKETVSSSNARDLSADVTLPEKSNRSDDSDERDDTEPEPVDKENEMDEDNASDYIHLFSDGFDKSDDTESTPNSAKKSTADKNSDSNFDLFSDDSDKPSSQPNQTNQSTDRLLSKPKANKRAYDDEFRDFEDTDDNDDFLEIEKTRGFNVEYSNSRVISPKKKKSRRVRSHRPLVDARLLGVSDERCVKVYSGAEQIDESKIIDDGDNSQKNIAEIRKQMHGRTIIAVCPGVPNTSFRDAIKETFIKKLDENKGTNPIIYFGSNVCFGLNSFVNQTINADLIIHGSVFLGDSFYDNTINGMCVLFNPVMTAEGSFITCDITKGLFVVGDGPVRCDKQRSYPIVQRKNSYYLYGENLMGAKYRSWMTIENDFTKLLEYAIGISA